MYSGLNTNIFKGKGVSLIKLLVISHNFTEQRFCKRWKLLSEFYPDVDVTLLAPKEWKWGSGSNYSFGKEFKYQGTGLNNERFRVNLIDMRQSRYFDWFSTGLVKEIRKYQPDLIFYIGHHLQYPLIETIFTAKLISAKTKLVAFSMSGIPNDFHNDTTNWKKEILNKVNKIKWNIVKHNCNAIFCHYPGARDVFQKDGFTKDIYIHTQIGVDTSLYRRDETARIAIRKKYNITDEYVFGSATRFSFNKGLLDVLMALPKNGNWRYLMMGSGNSHEEKQTKKKILELGLQKKVITPGFINWDEMPAYWSAIDCAIHYPKTTTDWVETFSLAVVQAMSCCLPVIGSDSGSLPYQIGEDGIIVPEGDIGALRNQMVRLVDNRTESKRIGKIMRQRAVRCFDIVHLTHCFYATILDILNDVSDPLKIDVASFQPLDFHKSTLSND